MLQGIGHEPVEHTPIVLAELTRRSILHLSETSQKLLASSRILEKLTWCLVALTIVLGLLALPPAIEVIAKRFTPPHASSAPVPTPPQPSSAAPNPREGH